MKYRWYTAFILIIIVGSSLLSYRGLLSVKSLYEKLFPNVLVLKTAYPVAVGKEGHKIIYKFQRARPPHWLSLREIPKPVVAAVLLSEDSSFFQHHGYSPEAIRAAIEYNQKPGIKIKRGGSTIT